MIMLLTGVPYLHSVGNGEHQLMEVVMSMLMEVERLAVGHKVLTGEVGEG